MTSSAGRRHLPASEVLPEAGIFDPDMRWELAFDYPNTKMHRAFCIFKGRDVGDYWHYWIIQCGEQAIFCFRTRQLRFWPSYDCEYAAEFPPVRGMVMSNRFELMTFAYDDNAERDQAYEAFRAGPFSPEALRLVNQL